MSISRGWFAALAALALSAAGSAQAAPVTYQFVNGSAFITATVGTTQLAGVSLALDGIFATFDQSAITLDDFEFTTAPNQMFTLSAPYGGYDQIWVNAASLTPGAGYANLYSSDNGGQNYSVTVAPVHTSGIYSASDSGGINPPVFNVPIMFDNQAPLTATIDVVLGTFTLQGVTLAELSGLPGETESLIVKADLSFEGMVPVPEPAGIVLASLALGALAVRRALSASF